MLQFTPFSMGEAGVSQISPTLQNLLQQQGGLQSPLGAKGCSRQAALHGEKGFPASKLPQEHCWSAGVSTRGVALRVAPGAAWTQTPC